MTFVWFIEKQMTVDFFIYYIFLPVTIIPTILINHAGRYTLPYPCRRLNKKGKYRSSKQSGRQGFHLACYYANLRNKSTIITTTFKGETDSHRATKSYKSTVTNSVTTADSQVKQLIAENPSISLDLFLFESELYWKSIPTLSPTITIFSTTAIDSFLYSFDVVEHYRTILSYLPTSQYKSIDPLSSQFQRILLEAKGLQTSIRQYGEILPLSSPAIYVSSNKNDLPIMIDTGASCTITPSLANFTSKPTKPDTATLGSLTTVQTKVSGQGPIEWDIEDVNGLLKKLKTTSYYVPEATICLFSPQAYFKANPKGHLTLNNNGIILHMPCGTNLNFPIQPGSNLPIMLTRQALHRS
jgi:hypothetical protein